MRKNCIEKPLCVVDQCSLFFTSRTDLEHFRMIRWLIKFFQVCTPPKIFGNTLKMLKGDTKELLISELRNKNIRIEKVSSYCRWIIDRENERKRINEIDDEGELECAALALELSREYPKIPIYLLTDDFKAIPSLTFFFQKQQIGTVFSSFDLLIYLYVHGISTLKWSLKAHKDLSGMISAEREFKYIWPTSPEYQNFLQETCRWRCGKCYQRW